MSKQQVKYDRSWPHTRIVVGESANVVPVDHPDTVNVSNGRWAYTSPVQSYDPSTGVFETLNTLYTPA